MMNFRSQAGIWNPENQKLEPIIIGVGSTGSFIGLTLAKMGFKNIQIIDFDKVEEHNIPNQFYRVDDKDSLKTDALGEIIKDFSGTEVKKINQKIEEDFEFEIGLNSVLVVCVDNMEVRKLIYKKVKEMPIILLDTRFGSEGFSIHTVDLTDEEEREKYEKSLERPVVDTPCGMKGVIYTILSLAAETCNILKKLDQNEPYPTILRREMKTYLFISKTKHL